MQKCLKLNIFLNNKVKKEFIKYNKKNKFINF